MRREMTAASDIYSLPQQREINIESCAFLGRTFHADFASMLLDDAVGHGKPKTRAALLPILRHVLSSEEWIVNTLDVFLRDSQASVRDDYPDSVAVGSYDPQRASVRHRVLRVQEQVQEDLL